MSKLESTLSSSYCFGDALSIMQTLSAIISLSTLLLGGLAFARSLFLTVAAEQRRHQAVIPQLGAQHAHLIRLGVLIPVLPSDSLQELEGLLQTLAQQTHPHSAVQWHLACTPPDQPRVNAWLKLFEQEHPSVLQGLAIQLWPPNDAHRTQAQGSSNTSVFSQLVHYTSERMLAQGRLYGAVVLKPSDRVKPDFLSTMAAHLTEYAVIQSYTVARDIPPPLPQGLVVQWQILQRRLMNRLDQAARSGVGIGARLLDSGWAIRMEVLERVPYRGQAAGLDRGDHWHYALQLADGGIPVMWSPMVVSFSPTVDADQRTGFRALMHWLRAQSMLACQRIQLGIALFPGAFWDFLRPGSPQLQANQWLAGILPPSAVIGWLAILALNATQWQPALKTGFAIWPMVLGAIVANQLLSLLVARCRRNEWGLALLASPVLWLCWMAYFPAYLLVVSVRGLMHLVTQAVELSLTILGQRSGQHRAYQQVATTRLNEAMTPTLATPEARVPGLLARNALNRETRETPLKIPLENRPIDPSAQRLQSPLQGSRTGVNESRPQVAAPPPVQPTEQPVSSETPTSVQVIQRFPIHIGLIQDPQQLTVCDAVLQYHPATPTQHPAGYRLVVAYKTVQVASAWHPQVHACARELQARLAPKGLCLKGELPSFPAMANPSDTSIPRTL